MFFSTVKCMTVLFKYIYIICFVIIVIKFWKTEKTIMSRIALGEVLLKKLHFLFNKVA
jgi:hypothetical protein